MLTDEQRRTVECADAWLKVQGLETYTNLNDTLIAVLNAIGYTEEFAAANPDLKVSEGVKLFLAAHNAGAQPLQPFAWFIQTDDLVEFYSWTKPGDRPDAFPLCRERIEVAQLSQAALRAEVRRDIALLAGYAEGSKSPRVVNAVHRIVAWLNQCEIERIDREEGGA